MKITLKAARVNCGLTMDEASEALGINVETLRNWEKGRTQPKVDMIQRCADTYGCEIDDINFFAYNSPNS